MTVGYWISETSAGLRTSAKAMTRRDDVHPDSALVVVQARREVYLGLARLVGLLAGVRPDRAELAVSTAEVILRGQSSHLDRLHVGLHAATLVVGPSYPPAGPPQTPVEVAMRRAADAVGVAGDIVASHLQFGTRPRTAEGVAIRAGGGVRAALADVALLTRDVLTVDAKLPGWLGRADPHDLGRFGPAAAAARWTTGSRLRAIAGQVMAAGAQAEPLLRLLEAAPASRDRVPAVQSANDAVAALRTARTWLWQHPDQVQGEHLRLAAQLGLAVHTVAGERAAGDPAVQVRQWRRATTVMADLHSTPTIGPGQAAAAELAETLRWIRDRLHPGHDEPAAERVEHVARLHGDLPLLAEALSRALPRIVARGELFRSAPELHKPVGKLLFYARTVWTPVTEPNADTRALTPGPRRVGASRRPWCAAGPADAGRAGLRCRQVGVPHAHAPEATGQRTTQL